MQNEYTIGGKIFTKEKLLEFGKKYHRAQHLWLRAMCIVLIVFLAYVAIGGIWCGIDIYARYLKDPSGDPLGIGEATGRALVIFGGISLAILPAPIFGLIYSFLAFKEEKCVKRAIDYYSSQLKNNVLEEIEPEEKEDITVLIKYKQLLEAGVITQEEYDTKKKELL